MKTFTPAEIATIKHHADKRVKVQTLAQWFGATVREIRGVLAVAQTAPSGAPKAGGNASGENAGTAAVPGEATGQPLSIVGKGLDEVPPLREVGEAVGAVEPVNQQGQSSRPTPTDSLGSPPQSDQGREPASQQKEAPHDEIAADAPAGQLQPADADGCGAGSPVAAVPARSPRVRRKRLPAGPAALPTGHPAAGRDVGCGCGSDGSAKRPARKLRTGLAAEIDPDRLRALLIDQGMTYEEAAEALGTTRNVVAGRAQRLGITKGTGVGGHKRRITHGRRAKSASVEQDHQPPALDPKEPHGCRWIEDEVGQPGNSWSYCQAEPHQPGSSWCAHHYARVYGRTKSDTYLEDIRVSAPGLGRGGMKVG
ncbi:hypothetical protein [Azospirillum tabaci]|uniref:hypothetical protein n=1 Tax=Azospirillum tabaci TaxID=2752310 RepID=UPI001660E5B9|nr:hypothetical protein [Azospirillum tabaci]